MNLYVRADSAKVVDDEGRFMLRVDTVDGDEFGFYLDNMVTFDLLASMAAAEEHRDQMERAFESRPIVSDRGIHPDPLEQADTFRDIARGK